jgi:hypothetical protein
LKGTKILTHNGYIKIEELTKNDLVKTVLHGYQRISIIGHKEMYHKACEERIANQLYTYSKNEYSEVFEELVLTGGHSILVPNFVSDDQRENVLQFLEKIYVTDKRYRLPACCDEKAAVYEKEGNYTIYHLALEHEEEMKNYGIYANGLLVESCCQYILLEESDMELSIFE